MWAVGEGCGGHVYLGRGMRKPDVPSPEPHRSPSGKLSSSSQILEADARHLSWGEAAAPPTPYPPKKTQVAGAPRRNLDPAAPLLDPGNLNLNVCLSTSPAPREKLVGPES